jgi:hypothetical protein
VGIHDDDVIEVRWATYNGNAVWVYLVAMLVDDPDWVLMREGGRLMAVPN